MRMSAIGCSGLGYSGLESSDTTVLLLSYDGSDGRERVYV